MLREFDKYRKDGYIDLNQLDTETEEKKSSSKYTFFFYVPGRKVLCKKTRRKGRRNT